MSREDYEETQEEAMRLVSLMGIQWIDSLSLDDKNKIAAALYSLLEVRQGVSRETARRHIARALRRQRHPDWQDPADGWGGAREGAGRPALG